MALPPSGAAYPAGNSPRPQIRFDVIGEAWKLFQAQMGTWITAELVLIAGYIVAMIIAWVLMMVLGGAITLIASKLPIAFLGLAFTLFIPIVLIFTAMNVLLAGLYNMALKQIRGEPIAVGDMFAMTNNLGPIIVAALLSGLIVAIGCVFCYLPGLIAAAMLMFTIPLIVDRRMDGIEAMKLSFETLKPDIVMATLFFIVVMIVGQIGGIACGIGALFTMPLMFLSIALLYRDFFMSQAIPAAAAPVTAPSAAPAVPVATPTVVPEQAAPPASVDETLAAPPAPEEEIPRAAPPEETPPPAV